MNEGNGTGTAVEERSELQSDDAGTGFDGDQPDVVVAWEDLPWMAIAEAKLHPLQTRILKVYIAGGVHSPNTLSQDFDLSLNIVAYHVRALKSLDLIKLYDERQRRGATEHLYVFNLKADPPKYEEGKAPKKLKTRSEAEAMKKTSAAKKRPTAA